MVNKQTLKMIRTYSPVVIIDVIIFFKLFFFAIINIIVVIIAFIIVITSRFQGQKLKTKRHFVFPY